MFRKLKKYWFRLTHPVIGEVWQLHRVTDEVSINPDVREYEITPRRLEALINQYIQENYHFLSVDQLYDIVKSVKNDKKFVVITLDDGYADNYEVAYPIFQKYNIPFCVFVSQEYVINGHPLYRFLSINQIKELSESPLCTIGSHTVSHTRLYGLSKEEQLKEIKDCKEWLEQIINRSIGYFAYPYGAYNLDTMSVICMCGVKMAFAAWGGKVRKNTPNWIFNIPRLLVTEKGMKE